MKTLKILAVFMIIALALIPQAMAAPGDVISLDDAQDRDADGIQNVDSSKDGFSSSGELDIWGIQDSDLDFSDMADVKTMGNVYTGIVPLRNMSFLVVAISGGLAITAVLVGIFILMMLAGYGAAHPNIEKGWKYLHGSQGKIVAVAGCFVLGLFMITLVFFSLYVFSQISLSL